MKVAITCAHCGKESARKAGAVNRARKKGAPMYCGKACAGAARRVPIEAKKARLAEYGRKRRAELADQIKAQKDEWYRQNQKEIYARHRERMDNDPEYRERHVACQRRCQSTPEWKEHKRQYDRKYRGKREYGELGEAFVVLMELVEEIDRQEPDRSVRAAENGTLNKSRTRKRQWQRERL